MIDPNPLNKAVPQAGAQPLHVTLVGRQVQHRDMASLSRRGFPVVRAPAAALPAGWWWWQTGVTSVRQTGQLLLPRGSPCITHLPAVFVVSCHDKLKAGLPNRSS